MPDGVPQKIEKKQEEKALAPISFSQDGGPGQRRLPAPLHEIRNEVAIDTGKTQLSVGDAVDLARDTVSYFEGMAGFTKWMMKLTGLSKEEEVVREKKIGCPRCDWGNREIATYCERCGERLTQVVTAQFTIIQQEEEVRRDA